MVEPWIVVPAVAGSSPVDHPIDIRNSFEAIHLRIIHLSLFKDLCYHRALCADSLGRDQASIK
jgi:hypothetical protein